MDKLAIGIPTNIGMVHIRFSISLMALQIPQETEVITASKAMVHLARNEIVKKAFGKFSHLLFIDDDMIFPSHLALRLMESKKDIIGGLAFQRRPPFWPCAYKLTGDGFKAILPKQDEIIEVDAIGLSGTLINMKVFEKLKEPWFYFKFENGKDWSEDFNFCIDAKKVGFKIFCDPTLRLDHIGDPQIITKETFLQHWKVNEKHAK